MSEIKRKKLTEEEMKKIIGNPYQEQDCNCYRMQPCLYCGGSGKVLVEKKDNKHISESG